MALWSHCVWAGTVLVRVDHASPLYALLSPIVWGAPHGLDGSWHTWKLFQRGWEGGRGDPDCKQLPCHYPLGVGFNILLLPLLPPGSGHGVKAAGADRGFSSSSKLEMEIVSSILA